MLNGLHKTLKYVLGARKLYKDQWVVTSWHVLVVKLFVICALNHGNLTIKIISNAIYLRKNLMMY